MLLIFLSYIILKQDKFRKIIVQYISPRFEIYQICANFASFTVHDIFSSFSFWQNESLHTIISTYIPHIPVIISGNAFTNRIIFPYGIRFIVELYLIVIWLYCFCIRNHLLKKCLFSHIVTMPWS